MDPDSTATALGIAPDQTGVYLGTLSYTQDEVMRLQNDVIRLKRRIDQQTETIGNILGVVDTLMVSVNNLLYAQQELRLRFDAKL